MQAPAQDTTAGPTGGAASEASPSPAAPVAPAAQKMKAVVHDQYGSFDGLGLREIDTPTPAPDQVRVRVHAVGLHVGDCFGVRGAPLPMRVVSGFWKPKLGIPGFDVAGRVESVGADVTRFAPGDEVFGACEGGCAEFVCIPADTLTAKPAGLTYSQAASIPTSALAALHALRDVAKLAPGQKVLINGASGGVGTFAVQIAKSYGAEVTGVCSGSHVEMVRSIGADHAIDYTKQDFSQQETRYDLIFDNVENRSLADCRRALTDDGMLIVNSGTGAKGWRMMVRLLKPLLLSLFVRHSLRRYLSMPNHADLAVLGEMAGSGELTPVIDRTYSLGETPEALCHIEAGHVGGKVVVEVLA